MLSLTIENMPYLPPFPFLCHFVLEIDNYDEIMDSLSEFPNLETLALHSYHLEFPNVVCSSVAMTGLTRLQHLRIRGCAPPAISMGTACKSHIAWQPEDTANTGLDTGCRMPSGKSALKMTFFSMVVGSHFSHPAMLCLQEILHGTSGLNLLQIHLPELGKRDAPFIVSPSCCVGFAKAHNLDIKATNGCWLKLKNIYLSWRNISINTLGVLFMDVPGVSNAAQTLEGFFKSKWGGEGQCAH